MNETFYPKGKEILLSLKHTKNTKNNFQFFFIIKNKLFYIIYLKIIIKLKMLKIIIKLKMLNKIYSF